MDAFDPWLLVRRPDGGWHNYRLPPGAWAASDSGAALQATLIAAALDEQGVPADWHDRVATRDDGHTFCPWHVSVHPHRPHDAAFTGPDGPAVVHDWTDKTGEDTR